MYECSGISNPDLPACTEPVVFTSLSGHRSCRMHAIAETAQSIATFTKRVVESGDDYLIPMIEDDVALLEVLSGPHPERASAEARRLNEARYGQSA